MPHADPTPIPPPEPSRGIAPLQALLRQRADSLCATLEFLSGEAELRDPATGRPRPAEAGLRLASALTVRVRRGRALLRFDDGSDVWLAAGAEMSLADWSPRSRTLRLTAGRALALVAREAQRAFQVVTPLGTARALGTAFETDAGDARSLSVAVLHGQVEVQTTQGQIRARQGQRVAASPTQPLAVRPLEPESAAWQWLSSDAEARRLASANPRIAEAWNAVSARLKALPLASSKKAGISMGKKVLFTVAILVAAGAAYWQWRPQPSAHQISGGEEFSGAGSELSTEDKPHRRVHRRVLEFVTPDGDRLQLEAQGEETWEQAAQRLPEHQRAAALTMIKRLPADLPERTDEAASALPDHDVVQREVRAGFDMIEQLQAQGMSAEEAHRIVNQGLTDSLRKQTGQDGITVTVHRDPTGRATRAVVVQKDVDHLVNEAQRKQASIEEETRGAADGDAAP